ncbi:hypothetical protein BCR35DRAFT_6096 [Leucosporidium creatinivorum]|uniref:Uncharacterized protein n=1 Tax=Leucosporidium creatinivorum TaxID=106004 RepID=A0A1Y2G417_9BASI|nr:hypothetical protein BCR35DRAFT_6096 [Leucosporidium creatinivorum]
MEDRPVRPLPTRRLRSSAAPAPAPSVVAPPQPKMGFHRRLQEATLSRALKLRRQIKLQSRLWAEAEKEWDSLMTDRQAHSDIQRAALQSVNDTIANSTALSNITRQLSADAVQISHDVRTLMNRYAARVVTILHVRALAERDAGVLTLERSTADLLAGELFSGLFADVSFEDIQGAHAQWEKTVDEAPEDSNTAHIASSWAHSQSSTLIARRAPSLTPLSFDSLFSRFINDSSPAHPVFETFEGLIPVQHLSDEALDHLLAHRTAIGSLMRPAAACQLGKMVEIDTRLAELSEQANRMREENSANWAKYNEIEESLERVRKTSAKLKEQMPVTQSKYEDHLLQLVILARGA